jgi:hypothetical protein
MVYQLSVEAGVDFSGEEVVYGLTKFTHTSLAMKQDLRFCREVS